MFQNHQHIHCKLFLYRFICPHMHVIIHFRNISSKLEISIGCDVTIRKLEMVTSHKEWSYISLVCHAVSYFQQNAIFIAVNTFFQTITMVTLTMVCSCVVKYQGRYSSLETIVVEKTMGKGNKSSKILSQLLKILCDLVSISLQNLVCSIVISWRTSVACIPPMTQIKATARAIYSILPCG